MAKELEIKENEQVPLDWGTFLDNMKLQLVQGHAVISMTNILITLSNDVSTVMLNLIELLLSFDCAWILCKSSY